jgi:hypothetical protein
MKNLIITLCLISTIVISCDLEKVIELELPAFEPQLNVEWYIQPNEPFRMLLTKTVSYFEAPQLPLVTNALVIVTFNGRSDTLKNRPLSINGKFFNYTSNLRAPMAAGTVFTMSIRDSSGKELRATTTLLNQVKIDSIRVLWNKTDTVASLLTTLTDDPTRANYYRRFLHRDTLDGKPESDTNFGDATATNGKLSIGSGFRYKVNDTMIVTLFHINKDYYDFQRSVDDARDANNSPFQQPSAIKSNIQGGVGIFTAMNGWRDTLIIRK